MDSLIEKILKSGVSFSQIEKETGVSRDRMYQWKKGKGKPKSDDSEKLQKWLNAKQAQLNHNDKINTDLSEDEKRLSIMYLSEANVKLADGHLRLIALLEKATADASKQSQPDGPSTIDKVLEAVSSVVVQKWPTKEAAEKALRNAVYGDQEALLVDGRKNE